MKYKRKTAFWAFVILTVLTVTTTFLPTGTARASTVCGTPVMVTLYAGQYIDVGTATVWNDQTHLYIEFNITGGWQLSQTHLAVATNLDNAGSTRRFQQPGVLKLVVTDRIRKRQQDRRATAAGQFRQRRRASTRKDDIRSAVPLGQISKKRFHHCLLP